MTDVPGLHQIGPETLTRGMAQQERLRRERALQRRRARIRRNRLTAGSLVSVIAVGIYGLVGLLQPSQRAASQPIRSVSLVGPSVQVAGTLAKLSWPDKGEGAVGLQGGGVIGSSPRQHEMPIASMTKMMTALVLLHDHPLRPGQQGPELTMTAADAMAWTLEEQNNDAIVPVNRGERLSEYQLLEALLMPSGDNIADLLATWDAHSMTKFVAKMNEYARSMGLLRTQYADASGVSPESRSTPADQVVVAGVLMANPVLRTIVDQSSILFPIAGTLHNVNPELGVDGIIGVKSGFTSQAEGCLATAAMRTIGGKRVMVIAVATGNLDGLYGAGRVDRQLLAEVKGSLLAITPSVNHLALTNAHLLGTSTPVPMHIIGDAPTLVAWKGLNITSHIVLSFGGQQNTSKLSATLVYTTPTGILGTAKLTNAVAGANQ